MNYIKRVLVFSLDMNLEKKINQTTGKFKYYYFEEAGSYPIFCNAKLTFTNIPKYMLGMKKSY